MLLLVQPTICFAESLIDTNLITNSCNSCNYPSRFRKSSDTELFKTNTKINLTGLKNLHISGSSQFSKNGLLLIKNSIGSNFNITVIDLREESHGFINDVAVSWENSLNNSNKNLSLEDILKDESQKLRDIPLNTLITFQNKGNLISKSTQTENTLVRDNDMSYIRIPVTDGGLPNEAMVDYFIKTLQFLPDNAWLHFHCKAGIGRTTTFMIMYDIMNNHNDVSLNDIILRQILLGQLTENDAKSFFSGEKFTFLNNFYNSCKANNCKATLKNITSNTDFYVKNSIMPKLLYVLNEDTMTPEEQTMISTLQGLIANKSSSQIYILSSKEPDYKIWLSNLQDEHEVECSLIENPWSLLDIFKSYVKGYVLYEGFSSPSINNACTLASLNNSIAIDKSLEHIVNDHGITKLIGDCINTDKYWAFDNLWNLGLNHSTVIELPPNKSTPLRDYAIMSKSLIFYEEDINDFSLRSKVFNSMDSTARCLGWGPDEHNNVSIASTFGVDIIPADWSYNLSVLSSYAPKILKQKNSSKEITMDNKVHYVTFVVSDGDNQQWYLGNNFTSHKWFGSNLRGNFNLGWSISPSLYYLAPTVFNEYYKAANSENTSDTFLVSPSGHGYIYPSKFPRNKLNKYTKRLNNYMKKVDQNYVMVIDDDSFHDVELWDKYTCHSNIKGIFYLNYRKHTDYNGEVLWSNNKPIVSCSNLLWSKLEDNQELIDNINSKVSKGLTDSSTPMAYSFVYVHAWSKTMEDLQYVVDKLSENPKIRIVAPDTFMKLIQMNVAH